MVAFNDHKNKPKSNVEDDMSAPIRAEILEVKPVGI